jgi:hypothetical protein
MSKKLLKLSDEWKKHPLVLENIPEGLSKNQRDMLTPVVINSNNVEGLRTGFLELFRKTNILFSPLTFRYSYAFNISGRRNVSAVPLYYLEKDINEMLSKYKIVTHINHLVPTGDSWEEEAYKNIKYFHDLSCEKAAHKLIKVKDSDSLFHGWECKELFKDKPVK